MFKVKGGCGSGERVRAKGGERLETEAAGEIRLIVRGDDIGSFHAANLACIETCVNGIVRSLEIMVPCAWYREAVRLLKENPGIDVGVHLTLTSEWEGVKWGPLTRAPSLTDPQGYFYPRNRQGEGAPPNTGFLDAQPNLQETEGELRAQIERALNDLPNVTHLTSHMGTPVITPELREMTQRLAEEYQLPLEIEGAKWAGSLGGQDASPEMKEAALAAILENLTPGTWLMVEHPGLDTPEMRGAGHAGYENVANDRNAVTCAFVSETAKEAVKRRGIRLMSYGEFYREKGNA
jgi:predicted glycoside hydrolase/deacetylase ChbG (UPF0249 family)